MANFRAVLAQLERERSRAQAEVQRLDQAIEVLQGLGRGGRRVGPRQGKRSGATRRPRRTMSAAARKRIAAAQKARWAKLRQERLKKAA